MYTFGDKIPLLKTLPGPAHLLGDTLTPRLALRPCLIKVLWLRGSTKTCVPHLECTVFFGSGYPAWDHIFHLLMSPTLPCISFYKWHISKSAAYVYVYRHPACIDIQIYICVHIYIYTISKESTGSLRAYVPIYTSSSLMQHCFKMWGYPIRVLSMTQIRISTLPDDNVLVKNRFLCLFLEILVCVAWGGIQPADLPGILSSLELEEHFGLIMPLLR